MADNKENPFKAMMAARQREPSNTPSEQAAKSPSHQVNNKNPDAPAPKAKPLSKRQDPDWITRTYYVKKSTDLEVEDEMLALRREGVELDKSDVVDAMLAAWVAYRRGMAPEHALEQVSPKRQG
ncbi:MAG: hypothetical protein RLZZ597_2185 [Cyanobacteriota bacterium]|jgi:hypothetical protein